MDLADNAIAVTAGGTHTCALLDTGVVNCWGANAYGQLGNGSTDDAGTNRDSPTTASLIPTKVPVQLPESATALTAGEFHTCALLDTGAVNCWGSNSYGQLGFGIVTSNEVLPAPPDLPFNTTTTVVAAGKLHTCAVLSTGAAYCWGAHAQGQLGYGDSDPFDLNVEIPQAVLLPITVPGPPTTVTAVAGDGEVVASWDAPAIAGGSEIDLYAVTSDPEGQSCTTTGALTCPVTGLTNGTSYTFTVTAQNTEGPSGLSDASAAVAPTAAEAPITVPGSPTKVTAVTGDGEVVVSWDAPVEDGGSTVTGYTVSSTPGAKTCTTTGSLTCTVNGLTNGTSYTFTVTAKNIEGPSVASDASAAVAPLMPTVQSVLPGRVFESRSGKPDFITVDGSFQGVGPIGAGEVAEFKVTGRAGVPDDAEAVFLNVVAVGPSGSGYLTVFPCGTTPPLASNGNYSTGDVAANAALAKIDVDGNVCVYTSAATDLVIDVNGYTTG